MKNKFKPLEKTSASLFDVWKPEERADSAALQNGENDEIVVKRASVWAIVALIFGALSLFSLLNLGFLTFSAFAVFAACWALISIARSGGELIGKRFALAGLALAIAGALAGPVRIETFKAVFDRQADAFCKIWFDAASRGDYLSLRQLGTPYWDRGAALNRREEVVFWKKFLEEEERHSAFHNFMTNPTLLTLAALGDRAKATYYKTTYEFLGATIETATRIYAVTVEPKPGTDEKKRTFFIELRLDRNVKVTPEGERSVGWTVTETEWTPLELDENGRPISSEEQRVARKEAQKQSQNQTQKQTQVETQNQAKKG